MTGRDPHPPPPRRAASRGASFAHAFAGWAFLFRSTPNAWIHLAISVAVVVGGLWLGLGALSWAVLVVTMSTVWVAEFLNTAIEAAVDLSSPEVHPLARAAKDVAAGGVLVAAVLSVIVGLLVLGPPLLARLAAP